MENTMKTKEQLIAEGRPQIKYEKDGKAFTQLFLTTEAMEKRVRELALKGYSVTIIQR